MQHKGICSESSLSSDITECSVKPPSFCDNEALTHKISSYGTIPINKKLINNIEHSIINEVPALIAISVYDSFESQSTAETGVVMMVFAMGQEFTCFTL